MNDISLSTALRLIRYNTDSEVATILQAALDELDRLGRVEKQAVELAKAALEGVIDRQAAWQVVKLTNTQIADAPSEAYWQEMNRAAKQSKEKL